MESKEWVVLLTNLHGAAGGIPAFNREFVDAFQSIAHQRGGVLKVYALNDKGGGASEARGEGYAYHSFGGNRWRFILESLKAARRADGIIFGHIHLSPLALAMPRARYWLIAHGIEVWGPLSWLRRVGLRRMDRVLCVSRFTRDRLVERHHVKEEKTILFPNTARIPRPDKNGSPERLEARTSPVILSVSRLWPEERYKKIDRVIEAMPSVLKSVPDAVYEIVGEGGDRPRLERLARQLGVDKHVVFRGALTEVQLKARYERCDVFILPSLGEGFGIVFLEAMAYGKPCIGADAGAIPEVIENGRTGLLVKPDSASDISEALVRMLKDAGLRCSMGRAGRERFMSLYSMERFKERLSNMMETVL